MTVIKSASTGPDPSYVYEMWTAPNDSEIVTAFNSLLITRPFSKYDTRMSTPTYVDGISKFYASFISYKNLPVKGIGK